MRFKTNTVIANPRLLRTHFDVPTSQIANKQYLYSKVGTH